ATDVEAAAPRRRRSAEAGATRRRGGPRAAEGGEGPRPLARPVCQAEPVRSPQGVEYVANAVAAARFAATRIGRHVNQVREKPPGGNRYNCVFLAAVGPT